MNTKSMLDRMIGAAEAKSLSVFLIQLNVPMAQQLTGDVIFKKQYRNIPLEVVETQRNNIRLKARGGIYDRVYTEDNLEFDGKEWVLRENSNASMGTSE